MNNSSNLRNTNAQTATSYGQFNQNLATSNSSNLANLGHSHANLGSNLGSNLTTAHTHPSLVQQVLLPTQIVEKPVAVHEEIRNETVEEIQPVVNVEKFKTEVHQITQPLFDKEVRPVHIERSTLNAQMLPDVNVPGSGISLPRDASTVNYQDSASMVVEKPAIFIETQKRQVIDEIQPIIYKETVVPTVIQETKPIFQKIIEGPVYSQEVLPPQSLGSSHYAYPSNQQTGLVNQPQTGFANQPQTGFVNQPQTGFVNQPQTGLANQSQTGLIPGVAVDRKLTTTTTTSQFPPQQNPL